MSNLMINARLSKRNRRLYKVKKMSQKSTAEQPIGDGNKMIRRRRFLIGMSVSAVSGVLITASMPNFDVSFLGWVALVPLVLAIEVLMDA